MGRINGWRLVKPYSGTIKTWERREMEFMVIEKDRDGYYKVVAPQGIRLNIPFFEDAQRIAVQYMRTGDLYKDIR